MRQRSIHEFESLFERASIPVLDIEPVAISRVAVVCEGGSLDASALEIARYLKRRFHGEAALLWSAQWSDEEALAVASQHELQPASAGFSSTEDLITQIRSRDAKLVVYPVSDGSDELARRLDSVVEGIDVPILIIRTPVESPEAVFRNVLHSVTGNFQQRRNFSYPFTLIEHQGKLLLLHSIDEDEIDDVRESLRVVSEATDRTAEELLGQLARHGEKYLKAVVTAAREMPCEVQYRLAVGDVLTKISDELQTGRYDLLVVGCHRQGRSHVAAEPYQLMHSVQDTPVLAL